MDKNAIKKYAVWARRELISRVSQKAQQFGITEKNIVDASADSVGGHLLSADEKKQRQALIARIKQKGYEQVMEEVAYTWFNRFIALRFMEVNGYLPTHVRVFTDEQNSFKPQILAEAIHLELDGLSMDRVYAFKEANNDEALYKYLLITQCNALSAILPGMFQRIDDHTELLFPDNLLREGSALEQMVTLIPEADWQDQVQIIGWLYQYYNTEPKDKVFADLKKNIKISKEKIPAATQLFTPDWIVRYMVENSLGRLWTEGHPDGELKANWKYYLEEAQQEPEVEAQLAEIRKEYAALKPEDIRCIDPCMGSGHILVYIFDVLMQIYESYGYIARDAVRSIVTNNLYGLDIDDRAAQLAYFAVMMKARQYDGRFFTRVVQPHVYAIYESNRISADLVNYFCGGDKELKEDIASLIAEMYDAKEYGSIINITPVNFNALYDRFDALYDEISMYHHQLYGELLPLVQVAQALAQKYDVVVTNPPYVGGRNMNTALLNYIVKFYPAGKADLFSAFIIRCNSFLNNNGYRSMITQHSWMFLSSFESLRKFEMQHEIINMAHLGPHAFEEIGGEVVQTTTWVSTKKRVIDYNGTYLRLVDYGSQCEKETAFINNENTVYVSMNHFTSIPGNPFAYWFKHVDIFCRGKRMEEYANPRQGLKTLDNDYYIRLWYEVSNDNIYFFAHNSEESINSKCKWFPLNHGGEYRQYYGNNYCVVNWLDNGKEMKKNAVAKYNSITRTITNIDSYFREGISWSVLCSAPSFRRYGYGFIFSNGGQCIVPDGDANLDYLVGLLNSKITAYILNILSPTLGFESGYVKKLPVIFSPENAPVASRLSDDCVLLAKNDWDSFETSWDFTRHPLVNIGISLINPETKAKEELLEYNFDYWTEICADRFAKLKANEEELNRIFIDIYGLQDELTPEVEDKDVTVHYICDSKEAAPDSLKNSNYLLTKKDVIKSLISYAVGCMFGRYSIYEDGLILAGQEFSSRFIPFAPVTDYQDYDPNKEYKVFICSDGTRVPARVFPDLDNVIPICDDEYFDDDIVGRFVKFIETVYGKETLNENLRFIADALGGSGQPKEVIRNYFLNDFYADHLKIYQKRPIYWLFDSGKKNGFKALIYMHRYAPDTIARMRTDYVHEQQARYRTAIADFGHRIENASITERVKLNKQLIKLQEQAEELRIYEEKIHHLADQMIRIDLDDGVKHNYEIFGDVLAKIK